MGLSPFKRTTSSTSDGAPPLTAKYSPIDPSKLIMFVGQDIDSVTDYADNLAHGRDVAGVTSYTALSDVPGASLRGLSPSLGNCPVDYGAGPVDCAALCLRHPHAALNLGLDITAVSLQKLLKGSQDENLLALAEFLTSLAPRPVFLRPGYECDGPWNGYNKRLFGEAYRYVVGHLREMDVDNFVSVWQVSTSRHSGNNIMDYWPGPDVVDFLGGSYFEYCAPLWKELFEVARKHGKPIIVCEAAPQGYDIPRGRRGDVAGNGSDCKRVGADHVWGHWFKPFFSWVKENRDVIRGVSVCFM